MSRAGDGRDAAAEDFGDDLRWFTGAVDAMVGELVGREALGVERAEAGFVAEERAARHGHAAGEQDVDGRIEPENGDPGVAKKIGAAGLRVGAAAESEDGAFLEFEGAAEGGAELLGFELAESGFAVAFEELRDGDAGGFFDTVVEIDEAPGELAREEGADRGFARAHETGEAKKR